MSIEWLRDQAARLSGEVHPCTIFGSCSFGSQCSYALFPKECCRFFLKGRCSHGESCRSLHLTAENVDDMVRLNLFDPQAAPTSASAGGRNKSTVRREHKPTSLPARLQELLPELSGELHPCLRLGSCAFGSDCEFLTTPVEACRQFLKGRCRFGRSCTSIHLDLDDINLLHEAGALRSKRQREPPSRSLEEEPPRSKRPRMDYDDLRVPERNGHDDRHVVRRERGPPPYIADDRGSRHGDRSRPDNLRFEIEFQALKSQLSGRRHPCTKFGRCQFGSECQFIQVPYEICRSFLKGRCKYGEDCSDFHLSWDTVNSCKLLEDVPENDEVPVEFSGQLHPCLRFGTCQFGDHCTYRSVPVEICRYHLKGRCSRQDSCKDVHVTWGWLERHGYVDIPDSDSRDGRSRR